MRTVNLKILLIFFLVLFYNVPNYAYQDSTKSEVRNLKQNTNTKDSFDNNIQVKIEKSFIERNEGQIVGSFLAGIVALFTVFLTHYMIRKKEKLYRENVYCNLLIGIQSDLTVHDYFSNFLYKSIKEIKRISHEQKKLIVEKVQPRLSLELINQCRLKLMNYDKINVELLNRINLYYSSIECLKTDLDLSAIPLIKEDFKSEEEYHKGIDNIFILLLTNIENLKKSRDELMNLIITDLQTFPHIMNNINHLKIQQ